MKTVEADTIDFSAEAGKFSSPLSQIPPAQVPALAPEPTTILNIIDRASRDPSVDIDKMERLIAMQERVQSRQAQVEYDNAMRAAQEGMTRIRADADNPQTRSKYATYGALDRAIRPAYTANGFSLSFGTGAAPADCVRVECCIAHIGGHREMRHIDMPADGKGAKGGDVMTKTHATGAAVTYGKRYLLNMIFNIAIGNDDDGNGANGDSDVESLGTGPRGEDGKLLSTYDVAKNARAKDIADRIVQSLNLSTNKEVAKELWAAEQVVPPKKRQAPLDWLRENAPGQFKRVQTCYENVVGLE